MPNVEHILFVLFMSVVDPMECNALKEQLTSIEDLFVSPESQDDGAEEDENDPMLMSEYSTDILGYFRVRFEI